MIRLASILALTALASMTVSCTIKASVDTIEITKARQLVVEQFGNDVVTLPGDHYVFIARAPDGSVWHVVTERYNPHVINSKTKIQAKTQLFSGAFEVPPGIEAE